MAQAQKPVTGEDQPPPVEVKTVGLVGVVTLCRPERRNALTGPLVEGVLEAVRTFETNGTVRALVLQGAGDSFCAGLDLDAFREDPPQPWRARFKGRWLELHLALRESAIPVVCALERYAIAGGSGLALACDLRVAGESSYLHVSEALLGMTAPLNLAWLTLDVGAARARELVMMARRVPANRLAEMGLVAEVVPDGEVKARALALATELASHPPGPHAATKRVLAAQVPGGDLRTWVAELAHSMERGG